MAHPKTSLILSLIMLGNSVVLAATPNEIVEAAENGVAWLAGQQNSSTGYWQDWGYQAGPTGLALIKLEERAFELGYTPFDPCYPYKENVEKGLAYLFSQMSIINISTQPHGNPDSSGDGKGVYLNSSAATYETGIAMMAIAASRAPNRVVNSPGSPVNGWTYRRVLVDMVDYMAFGQIDSGSGRGGWGYEHNEGGADNSNSGYAVSGLGYAESPRYGFGCVIPQFVKDELKIWIDYIQTDGNSGDGGGSGYGGPGNSVNILKTGNLVFQMTFAGIPLEDPNMQRALAYIGRKWNDSSQDPGWGNPAYGSSPRCQAVYCTSNGFQYSNIYTILVSGNQRDWYADFADALVNAQQTAGCWPTEDLGGTVLATEWALLTLEMPTSGPLPPGRGCLELTKVDDINDGDCVVPGRKITYTINYSYPYGPNLPDINNVSIIDYLPAEVDYNSSSPVGDYNALDRTVRWNLGTLHPTDSGHRELSVIVKNSVLPGQDIINVAEIEGDLSFGYAEVSTPVCYWSGNIIYVDNNAVGGLNNGASWDGAYINFNDALAIAPEYVKDLGNCEIWVANGTYEPTHEGEEYYDDTFQIPAGNIAIRGHFGGKGRYETNPDQRDFNNAGYETIFDGLVGSWEKANYVVTCDDIGEGLLLDGFTFTGAGSGGLYINYYSHPSIMRCKFTGNGSYGIYADNYSYPDVTDCRFLSNGYVGIYSENSAWPYIKNCAFDGSNNNYYAMQANASNMLIEDCIIRRQSSYGMYFTNSDIILNRCKIENNTGSGIYCANVNLEVTNCAIHGNGSNGIEMRDYSDPTISNNKICNNKGNGIYLYHCNTIMVKNNWIYHNGIGGTDSGLNLQNSIYSPVVRNNTIVENAPYGIYVYYGFDPCLTNDIVYDNGSDSGKNIYSERGVENVVANYCCIGGGFMGTGNISCDPCFRNQDTNDFHLRDDSNCIDAGDPSLDYEDETDIDGHCRVMFGKSDVRVDIGADEFSPKADYNGDLIVNFADFAILASKWRQNDPNISLDGDNDVDIYDLAQFCDDWLWVAPCSQMYQSFAQQSEGDLSMSAESESLVPINETCAIYVSEESVAAEPMTAEEPVTVKEPVMVEEPVDEQQPMTTEEPVENQQQSMLAGEGETASVWLVYDGNMMPQYGDEITVYIHSDANLFIMDLIAAVSGDANITSAMNEADCNNFGWENGWDSNPYIDPAGWVEIVGISLDSFFNGTPINGTVGYFKFRYYGGQVSISITADSTIYDNNVQPVLFSVEPLIFGSDPNQ